jgi:lysophospholipase L1-like esterase
VNVKRTWMVLPVVVAVAGFLGAGVAAAAPASQHEQGSHDQRSTDYYLSLGDSLSVGFEPDANGVGRPTAGGFDNDLLPGLRLADLLRGRNLALRELGCPGETTTTMINGGVCTIPQAKSQLDAAVAFLTAHRGHVPLVTIAIGANDVENCASATGIDPTCVQQGLAAIQTNLTTILDALHKADEGTSTRFIGLNEYDPFLAAFLQGTAGQQLAVQSAAVVDQLNSVLAAGYTPEGVRVADVSSAYRTDDFTDQAMLPGVGMVPVNVANICELTFECTAAPVGPNIHPQDSGYRVLARAVAAAL